MNVLLQHVSNDTDIPSFAQLTQWAESAFQQREGELVIRIVERNESQQLNRDFRGQDKPTNVLAFVPDAASNQYLEVPELGDIVACASIIAAEALAQQKSLTAHWVHMIIHACLHLCGYDHQTDEEAQTMEALEIELLARGGYPNPYEEID